MEFLPIKKKEEDRFLHYHLLPKQKHTAVIAENIKCHWSYPERSHKEAEESELLKDHFNCT